MSYDQFRVGMSQFFYCQGSNVNNRAKNVHSFSIRLKYRSIDLPKIGKTAGQFSNKDTYIPRSGQDTFTYSHM